MNLGSQRQTSGLTDVNTLLTTGAQKQQIEQNKELFPLDVLAKKAALLSGAQIPTSTTSTMDSSTLSKIATLGSLGAAAFAKGKNGEPSYVDRFTDWVKGGQQGPAPTPPPVDSAVPMTNPGGQPGGSLPGGTPSVIADGKGGYIDTKTNLPVNADGTPIDQSGDEYTTGGYWDDEGNYVENP
jgi:hypothetical protein